MLGHRDVEAAECSETWTGGPFILTYTGKQFYYDSFNEDSIDIRDIAHSLSHLCRYTGHTIMFYSVAQHSLLVSEKIQGGPAEKLTALLHDAAEAYTNDLASPLKRYMDKEEGGYSMYITLQDSIQATIYNKYGIKNISKDVRLYDNAAGVFEAEGFMGLSPEQLHGYRFATHLRKLWTPWDPVEFASLNSDVEFGEAEWKFIDRFETLMKELGRPL